MGYTQSIAQCLFMNCHDAQHRRINWLQIAAADGISCCVSFWMNGDGRHGLDGACRSVQPELQRHNSCLGCVCSYQKSKPSFLLTQHGNVFTFGPYSPHNIWRVAQVCTRLNGWMVAPQQSHNDIWVRDWRIFTGAVVRHTDQKSVGNGEFLEQLIIHHLIIELSSR